MSECAARRTGRRRFEVQLVAMPAGPDVVALEYPLYRRYQTMHHGDAPHEVWGSMLVPSFSRQEPVDLHAC